MILSDPSTSSLSLTSLVPILFLHFPLSIAISIVFSSILHHITVIIVLHTLSILSISASQFFPLLIKEFTLTHYTHSVSSSSHSSTCQCLLSLNLMPLIVLS